MIILGKKREGLLMDDPELADRLKIGLVFQNGALFDSLTVGENVGFQLIEHSHLPASRIKVSVRRRTQGQALFVSFCDENFGSLSFLRRRNVSRGAPLCKNFMEPLAGVCASLCGVQESGEKCALLLWLFKSQEGEARCCLPCSRPFLTTLCWVF